MKKILLDAGVMNEGGSVQVALSTLYYASRNSDYEWHLLASQQIVNQLDSNTKRGFKTITSLSMRTNFDRIRFGFSARKLCRQINPDLIYTILGPTYWRPKPLNIQGFASSLLLYDKKEYYNPRVKKPHIFKSLITNTLKVLMVKKSDYIIVETNLMKRLFSHNFNYPKNNIFVIENSYSPIFSNHIAHTPNKAKIGRIPIVFVPSSHYPNKNLEVIPYIALELKNLNVVLKFRFLLFGQPWENLSRLSQNLGVGNYLETVGRLDHKNMVKHYKSSSIVLLPTLVEASSAVYPESFRAEVPLITSDREFAHGLCGNAAVYCDPHNAKDAADKIVLLLKNNKLRRIKIKAGKYILKSNYLTPSEKWKKTLKTLNFILNK
jgi:glycosyltransferase involved in cell wall biosynthesis